MCVILLGTIWSNKCLLINAYCYFKSFILVKEKIAIYLPLIHLLIRFFSLRASVSPDPDPQLWLGFKHFLLYQIWQKKTHWLIKKKTRTDHWDSSKSETQSFVICKVGHVHFKLKAKPIESLSSRDQIYIYIVVVLLTLIKTTFWFLDTYFS